MFTILYVLQCEYVCLYLLMYYAILFTRITTNKIQFALTVFSDYPGPSFPPFTVDNGRFSAHMKLIFDIVDT
jgi:hypothetical protein